MRKQHELTRGDMELFVRESLYIEGIRRDPTAEEIQVHYSLLNLHELSTSTLEQFVSILEPKATLRARLGSNVTVGNHTPPLGGMNILYALNELLESINGGEIDAYDAHCEYENLHPFTDCNGRSGRAIWLWMMTGHELDREPVFLDRTFLENFYVASLEKYRERIAD